MFDRPGSGMRRVSSASGSARIQKSAPAHPLSLFVDHHKPELLMQMVTHPSSRMNKAIGAPPTPDSPVLAQQPTHDLTTRNASEGVGYGSNSVFATNATLSTPPTSPGVFSQMPSHQTYFCPMGEFNFNDHLGGVFGAEAGFAATINSSLHAISQPSSMCAAGPELTSYPLYPDLNEYSWPIASTRSSPGPKKDSDIFTAENFWNLAVGDF
jgi:hypothetical protein